MRPRTRTLIGVTLALALGGCGSSSSSTSTSKSSATPATSSTAASTSTTAASTPGPEGVPLEPGAALAPASTTAPGTTIDGLIRCAPIEQLAYHIHAHLQVYVDGQPRALPAAIGLLDPVSEQTAAGPFYGAQRCYYWLHTHTSDGILHIESPSARIYTLGEFFDEWRQPLSATQVAGARGTVSAFLNGKAWTKSPRDIPLLPHAVIQLDVGTPIVPFHPMSWAGLKL